MSPERRKAKQHLLKHKTLRFVVLCKCEAKISAQVEAQYILKYKKKNQAELNDRVPLTQNMSAVVMKMEPGQCLEISSQQQYHALMKSAKILRETGDFKFKLCTTILKSSGKRVAFAI